MEDSLDGILARTEQNNLEDAFVNATSHMMATGNSA